MKRIRLFFFLVLILLNIPIVSAHEQFSDGWHLVVNNDEGERGKSWTSQHKVWAYYENGKEIRRYSNLLGSHRGWGTAPENSLESFKLTKQNGYYRIETDVRFTSDDVPVLCHDTYINDVARNNDLTEIEEKVYVRNITYNELKNNYVFNIDRLNHGGTPTVLDNYSTNRITTFSEMLDFIKQNKMFVSIELKVGTEAQIRSLVKMTQDKNMHDYIIWISFSSNLLKFVKDYDDDENILLIRMNECDDTHNYYCGQDDDYYIGKLKTNNNFVWLDPVDRYNLPPVWNYNLPSKANEISPDQYKLSTIPQGNLNLLSTSITIDSKSKETINYKYDGDGTVKCISSDNSVVSCNVDTTNKKITITSLKNEKGSASVTVYATRGISYSATGDSKVSIYIDGPEPSKENTSTTTTTDNTTTKKYKRGDWHHNIDVNPPTSTFVALAFSITAIITIIASFIVISNIKENES